MAEKRDGVFVRVTWLARGTQEHDPRAASSTTVRGSTSPLKPWTRSLSRLWSIFWVSSPAPNLPSRFRAATSAASVTSPERNARRESRASGSVAQTRSTGARFQERKRARDTSALLVRLAPFRAAVANHLGVLGVSGDLPVVVVSSALSLTLRATANELLGIKTGRLKRSVAAGAAAEIAHQEAPDSRYEPLIANISPRAIRNTPVKN